MKSSAWTTKLASGEIIRMAVLSLPAVIYVALEQIARGRR